MSFTGDVKTQICQESLDTYTSKAQLCALFQMRASLHMTFKGMHISYQSENAAIAKHIYKLLKKTYGVDPQLSVIKKMKLKKNNVYRIQIHERCTEILEDLEILTDTGLHYSPSRKWIRSDKNARAYLQGCFLAGGSVNDPKTANYHLEISCVEENLAKAIQKLMVRYYLPAKIVKRKNNYIVYLKAGDKIADFLRLCNASQALFEFEDNRIQRDFFNQITRLDNCELANEVKTQKAAARQLEYIRIIEENESQIRLTDKIRHVMEMRKKFPMANMNELCDECYKEYGEVITKSGMKHRLNKIKELAEPFMEEKV